MLKYKMFLVFINHFSIFPSTLVMRVALNQFLQWAEIEFIAEKALSPLNTISLVRLTN
jgi:hypothetical protein